MKKGLFLLVVTVIVLSAIAYANDFEDCDYYRQKGIHNYRDLYYATHPTCSEIGVMWVECKVCGYTAIDPREDSKLPQ